MEATRFPLLVLFVCLLFPIVVSAAPVIRTGESVALKEDQAVSGDFYSFGGVVSTSAQVEGDAYIAGGTVTVNGPVSADLVVAAGTVQIHAPIGDDVRIMGGQVVIADHVAGDVVLFSGDVTILSTAEIKGDILFYGGTLDIKGAVTGSVVATGERINIDSSVGGDLTLKADKEIELGSHADIGGDIVYASPSELTRAIESVVVGDTMRRDDTSFVPQTNYRGSLFPYLAMLFSAFALRFIFGTRINALLDVPLRTHGMHALVGLGLFLTVPLAAILMLISIIGSLIGGSLLLLYFFALAIAYSLSATLVGAEIARLWKKRPEYGILATSIGAVALFVLSFIPIIGGILFFLVLLTVFGAIAAKIYRLAR